VDNCLQPKTAAARRKSTFAVNRAAKNFYRTIFDNYPFKAARFLLLFAPPFSVGHRKSAAPALTMPDGVGVSRFFPSVLFPGKSFAASFCRPDARIRRKRPC
jgi:hypothetical protein